jgi:hypothetical protein
MMKTKLISISLSMLWMLAACQPATSSPLVTAMLNNEFTLESGQSISVKKTDLTITFNAVLSDERCPIEIECAASGPVTVSLSVQQDGDTPAMVSLQTFTDQEGRAPSGSFEGIEDRIELGDFLIQVVGVLPYPRNLSGIKVSDYQATFLVTQK